MILNNVPLKEYNTFGIQAIASRFAHFSSIEELRELLSKRGNDKLLVLGGGSNILFTKDVEGLVIRNEIKGFEIVEEDADAVHVKAGAGEVWHEFVLKCIEMNFWWNRKFILDPRERWSQPNAKHRCLRCRNKRRV